MDEEIDQGVEEDEIEEGEDIQFAFQMADVALNPRQKIEKILGRPMLFYKNFSKKEVRFEVEKLLSRVELPADFSKRYPTELSGGQRQRVNLARAGSSGSATWRATSSPSKSTRTTSATTSTCTDSASESPTSSK